MSKFGGFLARKPVAVARPANPADAAADSSVDVDEELFSALGAQLGGDNEALRNLLLNANHKIGELDAIRDAVGRLVEPVTKALTDFESEKSEKVSLQALLNNTRAAYGKLQAELADLGKKATIAESNCGQLRQELAHTQLAARTLEATRAELAIEISARRAQIADLEGRLKHEATDTKALRDENRRLSDRQTVADKRVVQLETEINHFRQKLVLSDDEKHALQVALDKSVGESARLARRLAEAESGLTGVQGRLRAVEANFQEISTERARLAATLDEINERHESEVTTQRMRFEALQARAAATDRLLQEARDHLTTRTEEIRSFDRRLSETTLERDTLASRVAEMETDRIQRDSELREAENTKDTLIERSGALAKAYHNKESALARAQETINTLNARMALLETQVTEKSQNSLQEIEDLTGALRREKLERAVVDGALETARKDFSRLMREVMSLQRQRSAEEPPPKLRSANAA